MKKNSFRFKRNRKAIAALLICVGFVGIHPLAVFAEDDVNVVQTVQQQKQTITGIVKDATGEPVIGASVKEKGDPSNGVITDIDGNFRLSVPANATIEISFIGYQTASVKAISGKPLNIVLQENTEMLDEVVVVGYGTMRKKDLTGSVIQIRPDNLANEAPKTVQDVLRGTPGLNVGMDASAKGGGSLQIRGQRSLYTDGGHNDPLIILDGMMFYGELSELNPDDIAQIDVLKDASSTAIYGSAGANGVIIITTKRGAAGKVTVNLDTKYSISGGANFVHGMIGDEWYQYQREYYRTKNGDYPENFFQMYNSEAIQQAYENNQWIDWIDEATQGNASQKDVNLSIRGGSDKIKVYSSFSYNNTEGLLSNENQTRYGMRFNVDYDIRKWLKIGTSSALTYTIKNSRGKNIFTKSLTAFPLGKPYDDNGNINVEFIEGETSPFGDEIENQYANETRTIYANVNGYLEIIPLKGLSFRSQISTTLSSSRNGQYIGEHSLQGVENGYSSYVLVRLLRSFSCETLSANALRMPLSSSS